MRKKLFYIFMLIFLIFNLSSCPDEEVCKVTFYSYSYENDKYVEYFKQVADIGQTDIRQTLGDVKPTDPYFFEKDGFKYTFKGWTDAFPRDNEIMTTENSDFSISSDDEEILFDINYYAVYEKSLGSHTVKFMSFDSTAREYIEVSELPIDDGLTLNSLDQPEVSVIPRFNDKSYKFVCWTTSEPEGNTPAITGDEYGNETPITGDITLYAVYEEGPEIKYTVILKIFRTDADPQGYGGEDYRKFEEVRHETQLNSITEYATPNGIENYQNHKYSFKGWSTTLAETEGATPKTGEADFQENSIITKDLTLYAVYKDITQYTVTLKYFNDEDPGYTKEKVTENIEIGTPFKDAISFTAPEISEYDGNNYTFKHWTASVPEGNTPATTGDAYDNETPITGDITLYAVYDSHELVTLTFKYIQNGVYSGSLTKKVAKPSTFGDIQTSGITEETTIGGTKFSLIGWSEDTEDPTDILEDFNTAKEDPETEIDSDKTYYAIYQGDYLCFEAEEETIVKFDIKGTLDNTISLQYRKEDDPEFKSYTWNDVEAATTGEGFPISLSQGKKVYFKGNNSTFSKKDNFNYVNFNSTEKVKASGSVMSIANKRETVPSDYFFASLFSGCSKLTEVPSLPATTLTISCYASMFSGCTSLTKAPSLPAESLAIYCYDNMFFGCELLTEAPEVLPATDLKKGCYSTMFKDCTSLVKAPSLPAESLVNYCYFEMFAGCSSLKEVKVEATTIRSVDIIQPTDSWLQGVSSQGEFHCKSEAKADWESLGRNSGIPEGWQPIDIE